MAEPDPLEGFQITGYDESTQTVTIQIHRSLLDNTRSQQALIGKCIEIINRGPNVNTVSIEPRSKNGENLN